jgi:hypothetical protein
MKFNKLAVASPRSKAALFAAAAALLIAAALVGFLVTGGGIIVAALTVPLIWIYLADARGAPPTRELWYWTPAIGAILYFAWMSREESARGTRAALCAAALAASTVAAYAIVRWLRATPARQSD